MRRKRIFIDMDGVLAKYEPEAYTGLDPKWLRPGYFLSRVPMMNMIEAVRDLISSSNGRYEVHILSSVPDIYAAQDKMKWLSRYIPGIDEGCMLFPKCGEPKAGVVMGDLTRSDILLDDRCLNLHDWQQSGGLGIRVKNGINRGRSWSGDVIDASEEPLIISSKIRRYMTGKKYAMTDERLEIKGHVLHRIRALTDISLPDGTKIITGEEGGFIEKEQNLSHAGSCWAGGDSCIFGNAAVSGDAYVSGDACVYDSAWVGGRSQVLDSARVCEKSIVCEKATVRGEAYIGGYSEISGNALVYGDTYVSGRMLGDVIINEGRICEGHIGSEKDLKDDRRKQTL